MELAWEIASTAEVTMNGQPLPKEDIPIPAEIMDGWLRGLTKAEIRSIINHWRSRGLSKAEILRAMSIRNDGATLWADDDPISSVVLPVFDLQRQVGKKLVDWTWAQALEAFIEARSRDLAEVFELGRKFGEVDPATEMSTRQMLRIMVADNGTPVTTADLDLELAKRAILKVLPRAHQVYREWLDIRGSGLCGDIALSYHAKVSGYYGPNEANMQEETTKRGRRKARRLKRELDRDRYANELRAELHIPDDGFQDEDQAACWLYDRYPPIKKLAPYGPENSIHEYGPREIYGPAIMEVSVLAEATRRLAKRYEQQHEVKLEPAWDFLLCFYLLRGKLDSIPRKIVGRKRPKRAKHEQICQLYDRHQHAFKVALSYNCGLTDADWAEIGQKEPAAKRSWITGEEKYRIEEEAQKIAKKNKRTLRKEEERIDEVYVRWVRHWMKAERKT